MITSAQNSKVKLARLLAGRPKERGEAFLAEGVRLLEEACAAGWPFRFVLYSEELGERGQRLLEKLAARHIEAEQVASRLLQSVSETENAQGVIAVLDRAQLQPPPVLHFVLVPDSLRDPGNLGTLLRSARAAGVQAVWIPPQTADPFAPKVVRAGMGAHFHLPIERLGWEEIGTRARGLHVYLADMDGQSCWETDLRSPLVLIVGGEAEGASPEGRALAGAHVKVPMAAGAESLNAAVAGSVLLLEVVRQRTARS